MITSCDIYQKINSVQMSKMCDWMLCDYTLLFILCHSLLSLFHNKYRYYDYMFQKKKNSSKGISVPYKNHMFYPIFIEVDKFLFSEWKAVIIHVIIIPAKKIKKTPNKKKAPNKLGNFILGMHN